MWMMKAAGWLSRRRAIWNVTVSDWPTCTCGDSFEPDSWDAGFLAASGECASCDSAWDDGRLGRDERYVEAIDIPEGEYVTTSSAEEMENLGAKYLAQRVLELRFEARELRDEVREMRDDLHMAVSALKKEINA